ncbi:MAG: hypothetical protein FIA99_04570 [Ruminiclostridium sp.]|nr:hypothetical protein [Ruminiclostridium sp.]
MNEKDIAYIAFELIGLLTKIFQSKKINLEDYISNTVIKVHYLEDYIKINKDGSENIKIKRLLEQYNTMLKVSSVSSN